LIAVLNNPTPPSSLKKRRVWDKAIKLRGVKQFISRALSPNPSPSGRGAGVRV